MDCEKFDRVVLDLLYDELDELTAAATRRHVEHCTRCGLIASGLRATKEVGAVPLEEPPPTLFDSIIQAERNGHAALNFHQRLGRSISVMAGYAMRPQLTMAAVLLLMIGMSLLLLHGRPSETAVAEAERGVPELESDPGGAPTPFRNEAIEGRRASPSSSALATASEAAAQPAATLSARTEQLTNALSEFRSGRFTEAQRRFDEIARKGGPEAAEARLWSAQTVRKTKGCGAAIPLFESLRDSHAGETLADEANWQIGECQRAQGDLALARRTFGALLNSQAYRERARRALDSIGEGEGDLVASRRAPAPAREKAPEPRKAAAAAAARPAVAIPAAPAAAPPPEPRQEVGY